MKNKAFTFIELLLVIICIGILVTGAGFSFKHAKASHMADTLIQEIVILRTAIGTYYESRGTLPELSGKLSTFEEVKAFWKPFNPDSSNVLPNTYWRGKFSADLDQVELQLYQYVITNGKRVNSGTPVVFSQVELNALQKKIASICKFKNSIFYIFKESSSQNNSDLLK